MWGSQLFSFLSTDQAPDTTAHRAAFEAARATLRRSLARLEADAPTNGVYMPHVVESLLAMGTLLLTLTMDPQPLIEEPSADVPKDAEHD